MSCCIYWFSGTGNSLKVAKDLAANLQDVSLHAIAGLSEKTCTSPEECSVIGIIFPVYMFGIPLIVDRFLQNFKPASEAYVFTVATCGGMAGQAHDMVQRHLLKKGASLSAGYTIAMPGNYTPLYGAQSKKTQEKLFRKQEQMCAAIVKNIKEHSTVAYPKGGSLCNFLFSAPLYKYGSKRIPAQDKKFYTTAKCNACGLCLKVCPVSNITMEKDHPVWHQHCEQCMACLQWCPQQAIEAGFLTKGRKRFTNPHVEYTEIAAQQKH